MAESNRTDWKGMYEALSIDHERLEEEAVALRASVQNKQGVIDDLEDQLEDARKQIERARIQGMHDATGLLLRQA